MNPNPDAKALIENHLRAVRAHLAGKDESVQNEILDGLRDHITEALARHGAPVTAESVQAVLDGMDDPASYAEDPEPVARGGGRAASNKWLYIALAFLALNAVGVWKLIQIERKTSDGAARGQGYSDASVPHVSSRDAEGVHYPAAGNAGGAPPPAAPAPSHDPESGAPPLRAIAFLGNRGAVLQKPDQELSWRFSGEVVPQGGVAARLAQPPIKITPPVAGKFVWAAPTELVFKPAKPWDLGCSFTAELESGFAAGRYEGARVWKFNTPEISLTKLVQVPDHGKFAFTADFTMPVDPRQLAAALKLQYVDADGTKAPLEFDIRPLMGNRVMRIEAPVVPAVSFEFGIAAGLGSAGWGGGTREPVSSQLANSRTMTLSSAGFRPGADDGSRVLAVTFSSPLPAGDISGYFEFRPKLNISVARNPGAMSQALINAAFAPGTTYELVVRRGLASSDGCVLPYNAKREVVMASGAGHGRARDGVLAGFDRLTFAPSGGAITRGTEEVSWTFPCPMVESDRIGATVEKAPATFSPPVDGVFFWRTDKCLVFRPNTEWPLGRTFGVRLDNGLSNLNGEPYGGVLYWTLNVPSMKLAETAQLESSRGLSFGLRFSLPPDPESLRDRLKVYGYDNTGKRNDIGFRIESGNSGALTRIIRLAADSANQIRIVLEPGFRPETWKQGISEANEVAPVLTSVLRVDSVSIDASGAGAPCARIKFSDPVDPKTAAPFIRLEPEVKFTVERESNYSGNDTLRLLGPFAANRDYKVLVKPGLVSERGAPLDKEYTSTVRIPRAPATLAFGGQGGYLSPTGSMLVPVTSRNLAECKLSVVPVMENNLVYFAKRDSNRYSFSDGGYDDDDYGSGGLDDLIGNVKSIGTKLAAAPLNESQTTYLKLGETIKGRGAYLVRIDGEDVKNEDGNTRHVSDSELVVVTDLGISARIAASHVVVWVCSLKDAKPAAGVEVAAYSRNNQFIAKALTNADGVASIPCDASQKNTRPFLVTARLGDDLSYLALDGAPLDGAPESGDAERAYLTTGCEAFVYTDRGIFRPGETVHASAILRQADFSAPAPFPVVIQIIKPDGRLFQETTAVPNAFGSTAISTVMPDYLPTGRYTVRVRVPKAERDLGSATFLVEEFVPPQIRVSVKTDPERLAANGILKAGIRAEHLFGSAASGLKAAVKCIYSPIPFAPKAWKGYHFGREDFSRYGESGGTRFAMKTEDITGLALDGEGTVEVAIPTAVPASAPGPVQALVQASVFEQSGRAVTAARSAVIDPYPFYIGIRGMDRDWLKSGEPVKLNIAAVAPDGQAFKPAGPLAVRLSRIDWNYSYRRDSNGGYSYQCDRVVTLLAERTLDLSSGQADYEFTPSGYGQHELEFVDTASGTASSVGYYTSEWQQSWTTADRGEPDALTLKLDKAEYGVGETAKLTIQSPFAGTALLTIESSKVLQSRVIFLEKNTAEVDVEVKEGYAPNIYCTVSVIRPAVAESEWKGHRAFGSAPLKVAPANHRLNVALETPRVILPQSKLHAKVTLTDDAGKPLDGEVTLVAVDEAICMLTSFKTPSPLSWLYQLRRCGVESVDIYSQLMEVFAESVLSKQSHPSGDGDGLDEDAAARLTRRLNPIKANRFKPVALWAPPVSVTNGVAEIELDVPEFTGELRVMAVACNATRLGSAQSVVKVKRPLVVQPSLPRFLAPGDECLMPVSIYNETGSDITARLHVTCGGPLSSRTNELDLPLAKGASTTVEIPVVAGRMPGKGLCTVSCDAGAVHYSDTIEIAVRPPVSAEVVATSGSLAAGASLDVAAAKNWLPESVIRRVRVSAEPSLDLARGLEYLLRYPYGCIEQTTSASFPLLYMPDLANRTFDKSMTREAVRDYVESGIWRILSMQQSDGGFSYWPGYNDISPWGTSYATHFLIEARKAGYQVPQDSLDRAVKALRSAVEVSSPENRDEYGHGLFYDNMAYACYVITASGAPAPSWLERMLEMKSGLSYYARVLNASSLLVGGDPKRAVALLRELGLPAAGVRDYGGCFNSSTRNAALLLSAWLDIDPRNPDVAKLVQGLAKSRVNGRWHTTQENAMALMALGKYYNRAAGKVREFKGSLALPGGTTEDFDHTRNRKWEVKGAGDGKLTLSNNGPGELYYSLESEGVPVDMAEFYKQLEARNRGIAVTREWLDDKGSAIDPKTIRQNDLVVVKLVLDPNGHAYDNIVIEDLLPAGLEVENPNLDTAQALPWIREKSGWCANTEIRDDRVLLFTRPVSGSVAYYYLARAVTPGRFTVPPVSAECMYDPEVRSTTSQTEMVITK